MIFAALAGLVAKPLIGALLGSGGSTDSATVNKDETTTINKDVTQSKEGSVSTTGSTSGTSSGTSNQISQNEQSVENKSFTSDMLAGTQTQTTDLMSDFAKQLLEGNFAQGSENTSAGLDSMMKLAGLAENNATGFDAEGFVSSALARGEQDFQDNIVPSLNQFASNTGGTAETNSMSAILNMQAQDRFAINQNEIGSRAELTANQMSMDKLKLALDAAGGLTNSSLPFADILKGASSTTVGVNEQTREGEGGSSQVSIGSGSQATTTQQQQEAQQTQLVNELMKIIMNESGTTNVKTNQDSTGSGSESMGLFDGILAGIDVFKGIKNINQVAPIE